MPRAEPLQRATSFEEFLAFESRSQERHEFVGGNVFVVAGGTDRHNMIAGVLYSLLLPAALQRKCWAFINDVLVKTPNTFGYYPDVFVSRLTDLDEPRVKHGPIIIIEVLSETTESTDRGEKWQEYQTIPSLEQYVLLPQTQPSAEVFTRQDDGSWRYQKLAASTPLEFPSLDLKVSLEALYSNLPEA